MIIDTHTHYYNPKTKKLWTDSHMDELEKKDIKFAEICMDCYEADAMIAAISKCKSCIGLVLGHHPKYITTDTDIYSICNYLIERIVMYEGQIIGLKTGLDYYWITDERARKKQKEMLQFAINCAKRYNLPLILHVRGQTDCEEGQVQAEQDVLGILKQNDFRGSLVIHCFSGNAALVNRCLSENENTYFGIGGMITYPDSEELISAVRMIPRNRLLLETDSPYIKPFYPNMERVPGKKNSSLNLPVIIRTLASILECTPIEAENLTARNAVEFYRLKMDEIK